MMPVRLPPDADFAPVLALIRAEFAYMQGRIDPPSSLRDLTVAGIARQAAEGEVWVIGAPPLACMFLTYKENSLYLGKLAVAGSQRGRGLARALVTQAEARARALGLPVVELQTRVELTENHQTFQRLGFAEAARTAHKGHDRLTSITYRKSLSP